MFWRGSYGNSQSKSTNWRIIYSKEKAATRCFLQFAMAECQIINSGRILRCIWCLWCRKEFRRLSDVNIKATRKCYKRGFLILPDSNDEKYFVRMQKDWGCNFVPLKKIQILKTFLSMEGRLHPEVAFISTIQAGKADDFWNKHGNLCGKQRALQSPARKKTLQF